jgi:hypothetical protein
MFILYFVLLLIAFGERKLVGSERECVVPFLLAKRMMCREYWASAAKLISISPESKMLFFMDEFGYRTNF